MRKIAYYIAILCLITLSQCNQQKKLIPQGLQDNILAIDSGKIGFVLPENHANAPGLFNAIKKMKPELIYLAMIDTSDKPESPMFSVSKLVSDTSVPMEIAFTERTLRFNSSFNGKESELLDFGVYDKNGKRFRYKVSKPPFPNTYKIMYYFMQNDYSKYMYELAITTNKKRFGQSDSMMKKIAESFVFLK